MKSDKKIGFIGAGNMGEAFAGALIRTEIVSPTMICMSDVSTDRLDMMAKTYGINVTSDNFALFSDCDIAVLAVKPQQMTPVLSEIAGHKDYTVRDRKLVISIAAGFPIRKIENILYPQLNEQQREKLPIIRVMPNTPALVLSGMSGMSPNRHADADDIRITRTLLEAMGKVIEFEEEKLDAVTALSGSGPAYIFYMIEAMTEAGIQTGLGPDDAAIMTIATMEGAIRLLKERNESPASLRRKVTSPGGTTEAALKVMENNKFKQCIIDAVAAAARRSKELSAM
ncbi:MAG: pyrroline-5-carboxylate reductase [Desulfobacteraceae bacterium IS3]|nr:MAG: pyrroline-5-carboxylate reductase [Desulfobacteraceae bacterium IS3]